VVELMLYKQKYLMIDFKDKHKNLYLIKYGFFSLCLSFLGLPLYIHLPKFYHDNYGLSLATIGTSLFFLRIFDAIIDPILGILSEHFAFTQKKYLIIFGLSLALFYNAFFNLPEFQSEQFTLCWFIVCTIMVYLFFSLIFINYYNLGARLAKDASLIVKLSSFRELFGFLGMILASILPFILFKFLGSYSQAFVIYGMIFLILVVIALLLLPDLPKNYKLNLNNFSNPFRSLNYIYHHKSLRLLIILFFINSIPLAITSNLFTFYVDQVLLAKDLQAAYLVTYLLSGALCASSFSFIFKDSNKIHALIMLMIISIIGFSITYFIDSTNKEFFYLVCVISGFGLGGEMVLLPAMAAEMLKDNPQNGNVFFSIWGSCSKVSLALAAGIFLPLISNEKNIYYISNIIFFYAIIPLVIKVISIMLTVFLKTQISKGSA
jgi:GPH family glycoside/pentoside/hexuronide:cation symporter